MPNLENVLLRGTRAAQPLATAVGTGALYFVTDENVLEQSNGTIWQSYSGTTGSLGINQLTGDVTAGPGTGSQVATIANDVVTNAKLANVATATIKGRVTAATGDPEDLTGTQATTLLNIFTDTLKGLAPLSGGGAINFLRADGTWAAPAGVAQKKIIGITIDGGGSAITTGIKGYIRFPWAGTITKVTMLADQVGSIVIDIWKDTYANYPPTVADTITAAAKPTITAAIKSEDATLTGWTTAIAAGDCFGFNVDSAATVTRITLELEVTLS